MTRQFYISDYPKKNQIWDSPFIGDTPLEAAHNAFRVLSNETRFFDPMDGQSYLVFTLYDKQKQTSYDYIGTWVVLYHPIQIHNTKSEFIKRRPVVTRWSPGMEETFILKK